MSGSNIVEYWERGFVEEPPKQVASLLRDDEHLLWAARLKSVATARSLLVGGALSLIMAALDEYCGNHRRCPVLFYGIWPFVAFSAVAGSLQLWSAWKAEHRPWFITYALSNSRAFMIDESRSKDFRYIYLRLHPPKLAPKGILTFEGEKHVFVGLDSHSMSRAAYWATDGRLAFSQDQIGTTP